jgi:hypothetical protein
MRDEGRKAESGKLKAEMKTCRRIIVMLALLVAVIPAWAETWRAETFGKVYVEIVLNDSTVTSATIADFDTILAAVRTKHGLVLDVRTLKLVPEDSAQAIFLRAILGRLINASGDVNESGIAPRGEWQFTKPAVILADSSWKTEPITSAFAKHRRTGECDLSGDVKHARERLKFWVKAEDLMQQDRIYQMLNPKR